MVGSVYPEGIIPEPLSKYAVTLWSYNFSQTVFLLEFSTFDHVVLRDPLALCHSVCGDVLDTFLEYSPDPDTDIGGHDVHQTKPGKTFELVDIQLKRERWDDSI